MTRALMIAAPRSGSGKTTVTAALLAAWKRQGLSPVAMKAGPDYIDPAFHAAITGRPVCLLDSYALSPAQNSTLLRHAGKETSLVVIEAAMGLFDGLDTANGAAEGRRGAAADLASYYGIPVVLVLDITGQAQSAAAVALGFSALCPEIQIAGVILNRAGSPRHAAMARHACERAGIRVFGAIPRETGIELPSRHLGLVQACETPELPSLAQKLATLAEDHLDLPALQDAASVPMQLTTPEAVLLPPPAQKIAIARDAAFSFFYPHLAAAWRQAGAELSFFSPLANEVPSGDADLCWLPGGYPELHAGALALAGQFLSGLRAFAQTKPVHGECGGYMVLGETLTDRDGTVHRMSGLLSHATSFEKRRLHLGYRRAVVPDASVLGPPGTAVRGHEFHYSTQHVAGHDAPFALLEDGCGNPLGAAGGRRGLVSGSYFHVIAGEEL